MNTNNFILLILSACTQFNESHTGTAIASKMMEVLKSYDIDKKVHHFLSDNAANMIKCKFSTL